jgi:hypothetical protein
MLVIQELSLNTDAPRLPALRGQDEATFPHTDKPGGGAQVDAETLPLASQPAVDATHLPPAPSIVAELPRWITEARVLLRGKEGCALGDSGIGHAVQENFLAHLELLCHGWSEVYQKFQPGKFQCIRDLVAMMAWVERFLRSSEAQAETEAEKGPLGFPPPPPKQPEWLFACHGTVCEIAGLGERATLVWLTGLGYIEKLLRQPGRPIPYADLVAVTAPERATEAAEQTANEVLELDDWSDQPALDKQALRKYHERVKEIGAELAEARQSNDSGWQGRLEKEREEILAEVRKAMALGGVPRNLNSEENKLRCRIAAALNTARKAIKEAKMPKLAEHFRKNIHAESGQYIYNPEQPPPWSFTSP